MGASSDELGLIVEALLAAGERAGLDRDELAREINEALGRRTATCAGVIHGRG